MGQTTYYEVGNTYGCCVIYGDSICNEIRTSIDFIGIHIRIKSYVPYITHVRLLLSIYHLVYASAGLWIDRII